MKRTKAYDRLVSMGVTATRAYETAKEQYAQNAQSGDAFKAAFSCEGLHEHVVRINTLRDVAVEAFGKSESEYSAEVHAASKKA